MAGFGASPGSPEPARLNKQVGKKINAKIYVERKKKPTLEFELGYGSLVWALVLWGCPPRGQARPVQAMPPRDLSGSPTMCLSPRAPPLQTMGSVVASLPSLPSSLSPHSQVGLAYSWSTLGPRPAVLGSRHY